MMRRFDRLAIDADVAFRQQPLNGPARELRPFAAQENIQPLPRQRFVNNKNVRRVQGAEAGLAASRPLAFSCSCFQESRINKPTPTQMALSATLNAGKPSSAPLRR
jgi:hypothetical protein